MDKDGTPEPKEPADPPVKIKEEPRDDIKDFAETTMNELLGWYGYDKVDSQDTEHLNLNRFAGQDSDEDDEDDDDDDDLDDISCASRTPGPPDLTRDSISRDSLDSNSRLTAASPGSGSELAAQHQALVSALNSSQSASSKSPTGTPSEGSTPQPGSYIVCAWCQKPGVKLFTLKSSERGSKAFCSELCFTQCRRASFKKNKVCDWCKHVRHTVNYVDFQDGEQQLQFCSDKCLNQYKMNIFCKETQEHLQQIQSQMDTGTLPSAASSNQILITPDLWMQNGMQGSSKERKQKGEQDKPLNLQKTEEDKKDETIKAAIVGKREREREGESDGIHGDTNGEGFSIEKRFKIDKERLRRMRGRDSSSTPLSVTTSPGSSQLSTPASSNNLTPPMGNGPTFTQAFAGNPLLGALGPGALAHQPLLFHSLFGGAMPGAIPPGMLLAPDQQRPPGHSLRVSPTPENGTCGGRSANHGSGHAGRSSTPKPSPPTAHSLPGPRLPLHGLPPMPPLNPFPPGFPLPGAPPGLLGGNPLASLMPPATTLVPYPVLLPLFLPMPVPIPIPIPFPADGKLPSLKKKESPCKMEPTKAEIKVKVTSSEGKVTCAEAAAAVPSRDADHKQALKIQCACCQSETTPDGECNSGIRQLAQNGEVDDHEPVRMVIKTPVTDSECSVITSSSDMEDVVIDLSKDKSSSPSKDLPLSLVQAVDHNKNSTVLRVGHLTAPSDPHTTTNPLLGGLHTVTGAPLPPPQNHAYSSRRALLLDAPSVPRDRNRSPSPDRRLLLRNPTRDMLFGKRRCMRTRIKTK